MTVFQAFDNLDEVAIQLLVGGTQDFLVKLNTLLFWASLVPLFFFD